jgi:glycine cleavage system regulatory protein
MEVLVTQAVGKDRLENIDMLSRNQVGDRGEDAESRLAVLGGGRLCALEESWQDLWPGL